MAVFMDRDVTHKIWYGPKRSWGPYIILWVTDTYKSVRRHVFVIVYLRQKTSTDKIRKKTLYWWARSILYTYLLAMRTINLLLSE